MSTRTRRIRLAALLAVGIATLVIGLTYLTSPSEPSYQGKRLSEWIVPFCTQTPKGLNVPAGPEHYEELQPVRRAVSQIGTNGLPFLIATLNYRESVPHRAVRVLADEHGITAFQSTDPGVRRIRAIRALAILGPAARPAIPSLAAQLTDPLLSQHAVFALWDAAPEGTRELIKQYHKTDSSTRQLIATVLVFPESIYGGPDTNAPSLIPAGLRIEGLLLVARDLTSPFRLWAVEQLGASGPAASSAVPDLLSLIGDPNQEAMLRGSAARALGQIKAQPQLVVPALTNLLSDADYRTHMAAAYALRAFGYNAQLRPRMVEYDRLPSGLRAARGKALGKALGSGLVIRTNRY